MYLRENIRLALNGLRANKMRALLTMLGIIIGISSVIGIVTVGQALTNSVTNLLNDMGANSIAVQIAMRADEYGNVDYSRGYSEEDLISEEMLTQYCEAFSGKVHALAVSRSVGRGQAINGRNEVYGDLVGTNAGAIKIQNVDILAGHFLNETEVSGAKQVAVISDKFANELFPGVSLQQVLGQEIKMRVSRGVYTFMVVGLYHYEMTGFMEQVAGETTTNVFIPITVANKIRDDGQTGYTMFQVKATDAITDTRLFAEQTEQYFERHFYRGNPYVSIQAMSLDSMISQMTSMMDTLSIAISVIAAISLLVGGIGVMNIMLVSVTERTREIGTRKALGAKNSAIRIQFIVESMIICLIGGVLGIAAGSALGRFGSSLLGFPGWPSLDTVFVAVSFSMAIGVFFGYYPANKAAQLDPIEALRYE